MIVELKNIRKKYGKKVILDDMSLKLEQGCYMLLGPNGAGKSTLMGIIAGLVQMDGGDILIDGENVRNIGDSYLERIGYAPQYPRFYPNYTVTEFLEYMSLIRCSDRKNASDKISDVTDRVNLTDKADAKIKTLSGGMRQRLGIAAALMGNPEFIMLDEPSAGLDPLEHNRFKNIVSDISKDMTVLMATHMIADIKDISSKMLFLKNGKIFPVLIESENIEDAYVDFYK